MTDTTTDPSPPPRRRATRLGRLARLARRRVVVQPTRPPGFPRWWFAYFVAASAAGLAALVLGVIGVWTDNAQDAAARTANEVRDDKLAAIVACVDQYASASASTSKIIRGASERVAAATRARDRALERASSTFGDALLAQVTAEDLRSALADLTRASTELDQQAEQLERARARYPVPDPPSTFCDVTP